jgi:hypothetical protein
MQTISLEPTSDNRLAGWAAYVSAAASFVGTVFLVLFFTVGQPFGSLNDFFGGVLVSLAQLPLVLFFYRLHRAQYPRASLLVAWFGVAALLFFAVASALLILKAYGIVDFPFWLQGLAFVLAGIWLILVNYLSLVTATLPRALAWLGIVSGTPLGLICYPVWAIWLGRGLMSYPRVRD